MKPDMSIEEYETLGAAIGVLRGTDDWLPQKEIVNELVEALEHVHTWHFIQPEDERIIWSHLQTLREEFAGGDTDVAVQAVESLFRIFADRKWFRDMHPDPAA